jgi:hypothetical protein
MNATTPSRARPGFGRWVLATVGGWLLGIVAIVLLAGLGDLVDLGDQFSVGIGMGSGVGYTQWRVARKWFGATTQWVWASVVGMGTPFLLSDVIGASGSGIRFWMYLQVALGGVIVGCWQRKALQPHTARASWWVPTCIAGWLTGAVVVNLLVGGGHPRSSLEVWRNLGGIALGGVTLGVITGGALTYLLRPGAAAN